MESKFSPVINVYQDMYDFEDGHWWYLALRKMLLHWVKQIHPAVILDAGTGTGANLRMLHRSGYSAVGWTFPTMRSNSAESAGCNKSPKHLSQIYLMNLKHLIWSSAWMFCR
jgi:hypothetical protein